MCILLSVDVLFLIFGVKPFYLKRFLNLIFFFIVTASKFSIAGFRSVLLEIRRNKNEDRNLI